MKSYHLFILDSCSKYQLNFTLDFQNVSAKSVEYFLLISENLSHQIDIFTNTQSWHQFPYICSFRHYLHHVMLENVKLDVNW